ncbi:hypothetical protein ACFX2A_017511 [Malus domestica]
MAENNQPVSVLSLCKTKIREIDVNHNSPLVVGGGHDGEPAQPRLKPSSPPLLKVEAGDEKLELVEEAKPDADPLEAA